MSIFSKKKSRQKSSKKGGARKFIDLYDVKLNTYDSSAVKGSVKVAEIYSYEDMLPISDLIYSGNIIILDCSRIENDDSLMRRINGEALAIAKDQGGDVAAFKNMIILTPKGMVIDRNKIRGTSYIEAI